MRFLVPALFIALALSGCASESGDSNAPESFEREPTYENVQPGTANGFQFVSTLTDGNGTQFPTAAGIWAFGDYVFGSARNHRMFIANVADPENPELVYWAPEDSETVYARDADLIHHEDGRKTLVLATQFDGVHFWDVTVPEEAEFLARVVTDSANHNVGVLPNTTLVFNSQSGGDGTTNELIDAADPAFPVILGTYSTHGCHDIAFFGEFGGEKFRAYCAGIDRTEIWNLDNLDTSAPGFGITTVSTIDFDESPLESPVIGNPLFESYPLRTLHHLAMTNEDGTVLMIGDEHNGGGSPGTCFLYEDNTGASTPFGALWFYDISDETNPTLRSWFSPPLVAPDVPPAFTIPEDPTTINPTNPLGLLSNVPNCTAHFGTLVPGEEKIVMGWYSAGILLIDFSNIDSPALLDQYQPEGTNPWDARVQDGYVFTGDIGLGMQVLQLV